MRDFYQCPVCSLVSVPPEQFLSMEHEKKRYDLHQNSGKDQGYRAYLSRLAGPMLRRVRPGSRGLDFGCGPEAVLASLFRESGHFMAVYDLFYHRVDTVFETAYDFITASEVVEHLRDPHAELDRLWHGVRPGGILGIMTQWIDQAKAFSTWHYKNDRTHICFYAPQTFTWLGRKWGAEVIFPERDVALLWKADPA